MDEPNVPQPAILMSDTDFGSVHEISNIPALTQTYYTNVLLYSTKDKISLPFNASVGQIRTCTPADEQCFSEAIDHTAAQLADSWFTFATLNAHVDPESNNISCFYSRLPSQTSIPHRPWQVKDQQQEMIQAGLDSSILAPFLPEPDIPHPSAFPPTSPIHLDPKSDEYFEKVCTALELDGPLYSHLDPKLREEFKALVKKYSEIFYLPGSPLGTVKGFYHNIDTGTSPPMYKLPCRKSFSEMCAIKQELERMLKLNIIQPSTSSWGAPCILVRKPLEKGKPQPPRFVVDYRALNQVTKGDGYPIPSVSNILDTLGGGKIFAKLDLASGYWQVPVNPQHIPKTAFVTHLGLFDFLRMPYGLKTAPQTFQRILNTVYSDFLYQWLIIYIDDIVIWSNEPTEALQQYEKVFQRAQKFGLQFKPQKCYFFSGNLEILGHRITPTGHFPTAEGTEAIVNMPRPHNARSVKRFIGMVGYFREYIKNMSTRTQHLRSLLHKGLPFVWTAHHEHEFNDLKNALVSPDVMLYHPNWNAPFEVHTDASKLGCGAMLGQKFQGNLRPVKYASESFSPTESHWPTTHQELFAVKWGLEQFQPYILGHQLKVVTDHANLKWLTSISPKQAKLARWCMSMAEYDFHIEHRPGKELVVPDTLSRAPLPCPSDEIEAVIVPPEEVTTFLITAMGFDIPTHTPALVSQVFSPDLQCIALACDLSPPIFPVTQLPKLADKSQTTTQDASDTCNVTQGPPVSPNWSEDLSVLHPPY